PALAAPVSYGVGTDPVAVTIQDINGDGLPDMLVANKGSNDVSVIFGRIVAGQWVGTAGPRLKSGGDGPVATMLSNRNGDGIPDLVVANGQSGTLTVLPGVGQGFFDDRTPQSISLGGTLGLPSIADGSTFGVVLTGDGRLLGFDLGNLAGSVRTLFTFATPVNAVQTLANGSVVVALAGGTIEELLPDASGVFS